MTRFRRADPRILALLVALAFGPAAVAGTCDADFAQVDSLLATHAADRGLPGAAVSLFDAAGNVIHERYLGAYGPNTFVPIASATKSVSAAVIMSLVDDGTLSLDDRVETYLPQFAGTPNGAITVRQAFSQTSGLWNDDWPCLGDTTTTLAACAEEILNEAPRVSEPGETFFYGGNSMHVAGRIAEIAYCNRFPANCTGLGSGAIWVRIFDERIKTPLGLAMVYNSASNPRIAGGMFSRMSDYRRFWSMLLARGTLDGVAVLSPAAVDAMFADQIGGAVVFSSAAQPDVRYGLGVWRFLVDPSSSIGVLSDPGKFGFHPWIDLETGAGGIVMLNDLSGAAQSGGRHVAFQVERIVRGRLSPGGADADRDGDGWCDAADRCPTVFDPTNADSDGDGAGDACDCDIGNPRIWSAPGETGRTIFYGPPTCLTASYDPMSGAIDCFPTRNLLDWFQPDEAGGIVTDLRYDVLRSPRPEDFASEATCNASGIERIGPYNARYVIANPAPGALFAYLARAENACGSGPAGASSNGTEIVARDCP